MDDTQASPRRVSFLLQQVVVPNWMQVVLLVTYVYAYVNLLVSNPVLLGIATASVVGIAYVLNLLRQHAGQATDADNEAEAKAAPTMGEALSIRWRHYRTYQVWRLAVLATLSAGIIIEALGLVTLP